MAGQKPKSARAVAVEVLNRCDPRKNYAGTILDKVRYQTDQKQRATDLVFGTLRNRTAIDTVITTFSGRPIERIQAGVLNIIRVATYELVYCPSAEQYAIVNEAVANAKTAHSAKQAGFVNAVLRQITRHIICRGGSRTALNSPAVLTGGETTRTLLTSPTTGCRFDTSFLPDFQASPAEHLATAFSLPLWLVEGWIDEFGDESVLRICLASNRRPSVYIRPNTLKTTMEDLAENLAGEGIGFETVPDSQMIRLKSPRDVTQLPGFADGLFTVQDITAVKPVRMLSNLKLKTQNLKLLDLCAAPGSKTTQLAELTGETAKIIATDIDAARLEMVKENIARLGIKSVEVVPYGKLPGIADLQIANRESQTSNLKSQISNFKFNCILLDVPCSNTGVLAKRIEVRYRIRPQALTQLAEVQASLLRTAAALLKTGGKICYSTCSIQKEENSRIIEKFLDQNKKFKILSQQLTLPDAEGCDHDGGYAVILEKC